MKLHSHKILLVMIFLMIAIYIAQKIGEDYFYNWSSHVRVHKNSRKEFNVFPSTSWGVKVSA